LEEKVLYYEADKDQVIVKTNKGQYVAKKLIISAGAWLPELISKQYGQHFKIERQVLQWFEPKGSMEPYKSNNMPIFIWQLQNNKQGIYGFPAIDNLGVKIATEQTDIKTTADSVKRKAESEEIDEFYKTFIEKNFPGVSPIVTKSATCLYTVTPDSGFVIDKHPEHNNIIVASPCSGHGFKHSPAIGEILCQLVMDGKTKLDISKFSFERLQKYSLQRLAKL
jgi:sarcosine oxidase